MCMQAADVAHKAEVSELNKTIQRNGDLLNEKEVENKKLLKSAEEKDQRIQELKDDNEKLATLEKKTKELQDELQNKQEQIQASGSKASARLVCLPWFRC